MIGSGLKPFVAGSAVLAPKLSNAVSSVAPAKGGPRPGANSENGEEDTGGMMLRLASAGSNASRSLTLRPDTLI